MYDRFLERLSKSKYRNNFVLKGGFYLSTLFGVENRATVDIDTSFRNANFDEFYLKVLDYFKNVDKIIVIDSAQYRNIKDYSILKGQVIVMKTSIENYYERTLNRYKNTMEDNYNEVEFQKYANKKKDMFEWYKSLNKFLEEVDKI